VIEIPAAATRWLAEHHGVIAAADLKRCGLARPAQRRLVEQGVLRTAHKGVFVLTATRSTIEQRCAVLSAAHPTGFVTGPTLGGMLDVRRLPRTSSLHFSVRHGVHLTTELGVTWRQTTKLPESHRVRRPDGITVAAPKRLAFDLAADLRVLDLLSVLHQLLDRGLVTLSELHDIDDYLGHPAREGSGRFRQALERLGSGGAAQSHPEVALGEALRARGVPVEHQWVVTGRGGHVVHLDLAVPAVCWGVELDIHPEHRSIEGHGGDARRYRGLHLADWQVEPVSEDDMADVEGLADELAALYRARRDALAAPIGVLRGGHLAT
jgi:hypothetical protein